jgi:ATP-dependent DNA helicase PIF1
LEVNNKEALFITVQKLKLIISDEVPMASAYTLMVVNQLLKYIMEKYIFFDGKAIVFGGDYRQVLPIVPHDSRQLNIQNRIKFSSN